MGVEGILFIPGGELAWAAPTGLRSDFVRRKQLRWLADDNAEPTKQELFYHNQFQSNPALSRIWLLAASMSACVIRMRSLTAKACSAGIAVDIPMTSWI